METTTTQTNGSGNWIAFLFGAIFNLLGNVDMAIVTDYVVQAVVGGIICLMFKIIGDILSPLWLKHRDKIKSFTRIKNIRRKKRNGEN
jgi:hypothetical protein